MSDFSFDVVEKVSQKKPFIMIYGPAGVGKTTFAANAKKPIFIQTEDGSGELTIRTIKDGIFTSFEEVMAGLRYLYKNADEIDFDSLVIDSIDHLEPLVWKYVCQKNDWDSIESPGYGRGYIECDKAWQELIGALCLLKDKKGITIIVLAHDQIRIANDPMVEPYDIHEIKLHKRATALWKENADVIGLLRTIIVKDQKTGKAKGGTSPTLFVRPNAAYTAKTRYLTMPASIPISANDGWHDFAQYIPVLSNNKNEE